MGKQVNRGLELSGGRLPGDEAEVSRRSWRSAVSTRKGPNW